MVSKRAKAVIIENVGPIVDNHYGMSGEAPRVGIGMGMDRGMGRGMAFGMGASGSIPPDSP